jgi:hypothetical protein
LRLCVKEFSIGDNDTLISSTSQAYGFTFLDYRHLGLVDAHRLLGIHVRLQVHKILTHRLDKLGEDALHVLLWQARDCQATLARRAEDTRLPLLLRRAVEEYLACLQSWSEGAALDVFQHPWLEGVSALERALLLQHDESGCQTGFYRQADGSAILWHTEEDVEAVPGEHFDALRLVRFQVDDGQGTVEIHAFIYPDLLPGSAFAWRSDGYTQAVDSLHTRPFQSPIGGLLANCACWLSLRLGTAVDLGELLSALQPFYTGYAINATLRKDGRVEAHQFEFAGSYLTHQELGEPPGSTLFQANIFNDPRSAAARAMEHLTIEKWRNYRQRLYRTRRFLKEKKKGQSPIEEMAFLHKMISSHAGGHWAYANHDVKAHFLQRLSLDETETWLGSGPAVPGGYDLVIR